MIHTLPEEIILQIALYLNFYSKLNLAKTCRQLKNSLYTTVLYKDISIPHSHFSKILSRLKKKNIFDGSKIQCCLIKQHHLKVDFLPRIPALFPNVKVLGSSPFRQSAPCSQDLDLVRGLKDSLEVCERWIGDCLWNLLPTYTFQHLQQLALNANPNCVSVGKVRFVQTHDLHNLKNAPCLEVLRLFGFVVDMGFLEGLHKYSPRLKKLHFSNTFLEFTAVSEQQHIEPAAESLQHFKMMTKGSFMYDNSFLLQYMILKYPKLKTLRLSLEDNKRNGYQGPNFLNHLQQLAIHLEELRLNFDPTKGHNTITLTGSAFHMVFPCRHLLFYSARTMSRSYFDFLANVKQLHLPIISGSYLYNKKIILPSITYLRLFDVGAVKPNSTVIYLDELLFTFRGLKTLEIENSQVIVSLGKTDYKIHCLSLHRIEFYIKNIQYRVLRFIKTSIPNLNHIHLKTLDRHDSFNLHLPHHTLHSLKLNIFCSNRSKGKWKYYYKIKTDIKIRKIDYIHTGYDDIKVRRHGFTLRYRSKGKIRIVCKDLLELKHNNIIIF